ncbi:MAG: hypothetical protein KGI29_04725 [Pseudomonadota bacterium]|nr:hypothetical protein [Pseudomonadota bacterium]MDE3038672.1 hypothetical protein [Pseudomonadota bacterium]
MDTLSALYSLNGLIVGAAFLPQVITLLKDRSGAVAISISSYLIFNVIGLISLAYGVLKLHDALFIFYCVISVVGNLVVLGLAIYRRWQTVMQDKKQHLSFHYPF